MTAVRMGGRYEMQVAVVLNALGLSYDTKTIEFSTGDHKKPKYLTLNPNGKIPALVDNESGYTLWESGAIISYLVDKYDKEHLISAATPEEKHKELQWLFFQATGHSPPIFQAAIFKWFHPDPLPSAITKFQTEVVRVLSVLEGVLSEHEWLAGEKVTVADLCFVPSNEVVFGPLLMPEEYDLKNKFPAVWAWHQNMVELPYVKDCVKKQRAWWQNAFAGK
ncbi:glutathione S-transferase C-terminal-like protein [Pseudohyphozyma bogoriensis]|nr:glutathione S-transferase C-terminal-like protein [Pseudohyphozyma bogoriensis]